MTPEHLGVGCHCGYDTSRRPRAVPASRRVRRAAEPAAVAAVVKAAATYYESEPPRTFLERPSRTWARESTGPGQGQVRQRKSSRAGWRVTDELVTTAEKHGSSGNS